MKWLFLLRVKIQEGHSKDPDDREDLYPFAQQGCCRVLNCCDRFVLSIAE